MSKLKVAIGPNEQSPTGGKLFNRFSSQLQKKK